MRLFLDTEFLDDGRTIELISLAVAAEDGREFYAENAEADMARIGHPVERRHHALDDARWIRETWVRYVRGGG